MLIYVPNPAWSLGTGWKRCGGEANSEYPGGIIAYRRGEINLLITEDAELFDRFMAATHVAKKLNLLAKRDRILLFQAVLYANKWEE